MSDSTFLIKLGLNTDALVAGINKSNTLLSGFQSQITSFGRQIATGLGFTSLGYAITQTVESMATFEKSMSEVKAISGATAQEFEILKNNALNLAGAFSALDISKLETEFSRLGFSVQEIQDSTKAVINLASATGSDLATSAVTAGSTLRAFGLDAKEMGRLTDVVAGGLNRTALDMSNFTEAIKYVAPQARASNISLEETVALLGVLADNGIKGSMAGTTLRRLLQDLATDSRPLIDRLKELSLRGLNAADAMTEVGRIGSTGLLVLTNNVDKINKVTDSLHHVTGEAQAMSNVMQDNLIGDWKKLNAEFDRTINSNTSGVILGIRAAVNSLTSALAGTSKGTSFNFWEAIGLGGFGDSDERANKIFSNLDTLSKKIKNIGLSAGTDLKLNIPDKSSPATGATSSLNDLKKKIEELTKTMGDEKTHAGIKHYADQIEDLTKKIFKLTNGFTEAQLKLAEFHAKAFGNNGQHGQDLIGMIQGARDKNPMAAYTDKDGNLIPQNLVTDTNKKSEQINAMLKGVASSWQRFGSQVRTQAVQLGTDFSHALSGVISGTQTFAQAIAQMAIQVIDSLERMALAFVIENAARAAATTGNPIAFPIVAAAAIIAGAAVLRSAFNAIGGSGGNSGGVSSGGGNIRTSPAVAALPPGGFVIQGRDLVYVYDKNKAYSNYQTG